MRNIAVLVIISTLLISCVTMSNGANWMLADFSAYDKNYSDFDLSVITIGAPESSAYDLFPPYKPKVVAATKTSKILQYEKWRAIAGPDYLEQKLFIKIENGEISEYRLVNDVAVTNPW